jgi:hypothetical protein
MKPQSTKQTHQRILVQIVAVLGMGNSKTNVSAREHPMLPSALILCRCIIMETLANLPRIGNQQKGTESGETSKCSEGNHESTYAKKPELTLLGHGCSYMCHAWLSCESRQTSSVRVDQLRCHPHFSTTSSGLYMFHYDAATLSWRMILIHKTRSPQSCQTLRDVEHQMLSRTQLQEHRFWCLFPTATDSSEKCSRT